VSAVTDTPIESAKPRKLALGLILCAILSNVSYSIMWNSVVVALPHMQGQFAATKDQVAWVMIAYLLGSGIATSVIGWFSSRFGRKRVFCSALALFCVSLVGCGVATSMEEMVFWRLVQGLAGAPMVPLTQILVVNAFPPEQHSRATSIWAFGFISANLFSPVLAGNIIASLGWEWIFLIILPFSLLALVWSFFVVPDTEPSGEKLDWFGFMTLILAVGALQVGLARGERLGWGDSVEVLILLSCAGFFLYWFLVHTIGKPNTFVDTKLFRSRNFSLGLTFIFLIGVVLYLPMFFLPLMLRDVADYPPEAIGNILMSRGAGTVCTLLLVGFLRDRVEPKLLVTIGLLMAAGPTWFMARWSVDVDPGQVIMANFFQGLSAGFIWAPVNKLALGDLRDAAQDKGYALFYLVFDIGNAIGTAAFITFWTHYAAINRAWISESVTPYSDTWRQSGLLDDGENLGLIADEMTRQAAVIAFNNCYFAMGVILIALIPLLLLFKTGKEPNH